YLKDHRVGEAIWLPAAALLEMALEAARKVHPGRSASVEQVAFAHAVELVESKRTRLQLVLHPATAGAHASSIASRPADDPSVAWVSTVSGYSRPIDAPAPQRMSIDELRARCPNVTSTRALYTRLADAGLHYGPAFQGILEATRGAREALAKLAASP